MMKKLLVSLTSLSILLLPVVVSAHEHQVIKIGGKQYVFTIGSLNEPLFVDDKTGVDLRVEEIPLTAHHDAAGTPVAGLEKTLKVEISAADKNKVMDLSPAFGNPGAYLAPFYPTVATSYSYRFFGTINGVEVNLGFTCNPAGHPVTPEDMSEIILSDNVIRVMKSGAFGCPRPRSDASFPEVVASGVELSSKTDSAGNKANLSTMMGIAGIVLGAVGIILGTIALRKVRKPL